jgi:pimeloyl-ACP methyl ester carboxylesterase
MPVSDLGAAIDARVTEQPGAASVIVLVHGRSCGGGGCPLGFPEARARAAGPALAYLTQVLSAYRATAGNKLGARKVVLLAHSMGNLVLEAAVGGTSTLPRDVFDTVLVGSAVRRTSR